MYTYSFKNDWSSSDRISLNEIIFKLFYLEQVFTTNSSTDKDKLSYFLGGDVELSVSFVGKNYSLKVGLIEFQNIFHQVSLLPQT